MAEPISSRDAASNPSGTGAIRLGLTRSSVTVLLPSPARLRLSASRQSLTSTSAVSWRLPSSASRAICAQSCANGTPDARPLNVPPAPIVMRSSGRAGASVIGAAGASSPARANSQPAARVSASGTARANRPAIPRMAKPSARLAPEPPNFSGTHASSSPASPSVCQSGSFQAPFPILLMVCGSARSAKIRAAVSATI